MAALSPIGYRDTAIIMPAKSIIASSSLLLVNISLIVLITYFPPIINIINDSHD